jgi:hypothetical protein
MDFSRRELLGLVAAGVVAGCSSGEPSGDAETVTAPPPGGPADNGSDDAGTSLAGSCASNFGDTLQPYDVGDRDMIATFSYPMGGEITTEQDNPNSHVTGFGYGRGEVSALHTLTVSETGPTGEPPDATEAYEFDDRFEDGTVGTYGGQQRPVAIRRTGDSSVTYIFHVDSPDGVYVFSVQTAVGAGEPCPDAYESVTRRVAASFEPVR